MKKLLSLLPLILSIALIQASAQAAVSSVPISIDYDCCNVEASSYHEIYSPALRGVKSISLMNSGSVGVLLAIGGIGSEVDQLVIPASSLVPVVYPVVMGQGTRFTLKSQGSTGAVGGAKINFILN